MILRSNDPNFYVDITSDSPEVTGSCIHLSVHYPDNTSTNFVVDCGFFQEQKYDDLNYKLSFDPTEVDFLLVTHAHVDHIGRIPYIMDNGFAGPIYCSKDTETLMPISLADNCRIIRHNAKKRNTPVLYGPENVGKVKDLIHGVDYEKTIQVTDHIKVTFYKNGHIIGAATIFVEITFPNCKPWFFIFSGDFNNSNPFFEVPPLPKKLYDLPVFIFIESTYGYMDSSEVARCFDNNVCDFFYEYPNGSLVIPCFSLRFQEVLLKIRKMQEYGLLNPHIPVYLDGKLGIQYTDLFINKTITSIDEDKYGFMPSRVKNVTKEIRSNRYVSSKAQIIITSSGTASYGPAQTYLQNMLPRKDVLFHFTGYSPEGTLSRKLKDAPEDSFVQVGGILVKKTAKIKFTNEFSAHAKRNELVNFLRPFKNIQAVFPTHGAEESKLLIGKEALLHTSARYVGILSDKVCFRVNSDGLVSSTDKMSI